MAKELCWDCGKHRATEWDDRCANCVRNDVIELAGAGNFDAAFDAIGDGDISEIL